MAPLVPETIYHVYNRGNNRQNIFLKKRNYSYFLQKTAAELKSHLDILAYCLMPNHFHFLIYTHESLDPKKFSTSFRVLLSSYTRAIQKQEGWVGSLFQQNTKGKEIADNRYAQTCFHYIHQNPLRSNLVDKIENWPYHSFNEYWLDETGICNVGLGREILAIPVTKDLFYSESY